MKKVLILVFALVLVVALLCGAVAETLSYAMTETGDAEETSFTRFLMMAHKSLALTAISAN